MVSKGIMEREIKEEIARLAAVAYAKNVGEYHLAHGNIKQYRVLDNGDLVVVPNTPIPYIKLEFVTTKTGLFEEYDKKTEEEKS